jgi:hypothetical protein
MKFSVPTATSLMMLAKYFPLRFQKHFAQSRLANLIILRVELIKAMERISVLDWRGRPFG